MNLLQHASTFNPNGSLSSTEDKFTQKQTKKLQKVKVTKRRTRVQQVRVAILGIQLETQSPRLLARSPSRPTKCKDALNHNLDVEENWTPPSTSPPSPRAPPAGLFTSSPAPLVEGTVKRGTSILVTHKIVRQMPDQVSHLGRQLEEN